MVRRNNNTRNRRRNRNGGLRGRINNNLSLLGSTRTQPFMSVLSRFNLSTALAGVNNNLFTIAQLINGDLNTRLVRLASIVVRFHPYNQATTSGSHYSAQLQAVDPLSPSTSIMPISAEKPLSSTIVTVLRGTSPFISTWQPAGSTATILNIPVWAQAVLTTGLFADITTMWLVAQDNLT